MSRKCCVKGCKTNRNRSLPTISTFQFPKDLKEREEWLKSMHQTTLVIRKKTVVCANHFLPQFIRRSDVFKCKGGVVVEIPRDPPRLTRDAIPTIFPSFTSPLPAGRTGTVGEDEIMDETLRLAKEKAAFFDKDRIKTFEEFTNNLKTRDINPFTALFKDTHVTLLHIPDDTFSVNTVNAIVCKISNELKVKVFMRDGLLQMKEFKQFLGEDMKCSTWSKFNRLLHTLKNPSYEMTLSDKVNLFVNYINNCAAASDLDSEKKTKLQFLTEQLKLVFPLMPHYSPETLVWAGTQCYFHSAAYESLRNSKRLTLPHPKHLQKLLKRISDVNSELTTNDVAYLDEEIKMLGEVEVQGDVHFLFDHV